MRKRRNLYKVVDQNGKQVFGDLLTAKQVSEKIGCTSANVGQAAADFALVDKKYRIIPEDIKLSKRLDITPRMGQGTEKDLAGSREGDMNKRQKKKLFNRKSGFRLVKLPHKLKWSANKWN